MIEAHGKLSLDSLGFEAESVATLRDLMEAAYGMLLVTGPTGSGKTTTLYAALSETHSNANILANPRIRARNREKAKILIGERVPNITTTSTSTGFVAESVNYVDVGLKLEVEPTVYLDGEVAIKIALEVSNIISQVQTKSGSVAYQIGTRTAQTVLRLKDGENQVLAGLINDEDRRSANKVPGVGEVPVVGRLFGNQSDDASKTEIVLSITPRIVRNVRRPEASLIEFESGTENSLGIRPATAAAPTAVPAGQAPVPSSTPSTSASTGGGVAVAAQAINNSAQIVSVDTSTTPAAAVGNASLRLQGPAQVKVGDIFAVQLVMQSDQPVVSVPLALSFDPRVLQVTSVLEGDFLRQGGAQTNFTSRVDLNGQILATGTRSGETGATATGVFTTINFRATAASVPETRVQLLTAAPIGLGGRSLTAAPATPHIVRLVN